MTPVPESLIAEVEEAKERMEKRAVEIEGHVAKVAGYYPEAIQHAADIRAVLALLPQALMVESKQS